MCGHRQAEPVVLATGETVASVCISCFGELPPGYITDQRRRAEAIAYCDHADTIDITSFGQLPRTEVICAGCGARNP